MRAPRIVAVTLLVVGTLAFAAPTVSADCAPDDTACQTQEWLGDFQAWLDYCLHQKPPFLGDTWTCFVNPAP